MIRSCRIKPCFAPIPWPSDQKDNETERLYNFYLADDVLSRGSFLQYCRVKHVVDGRVVNYRIPVDKPTLAIGVRHCSEMKDNYVGQVATMHMPH